MKSEKVGFYIFDHCNHWIFVELSYNVTYVSFKHCKVPVHYISLYY